MQKRGEHVLYQQSGQIYDALVLESATANGDLLGKDGQPALHLVVIFPDPPNKRIHVGELPEPTILHDVVHASQRFDDEYIRKYGVAEARQHRGLGDWVTSLDDKGLPSAADLDAVAAEQKAKEATAKPKRIRRIKGV